MKLYRWITLMVSAAMVISLAAFGLGQVSSGVASAASSKFTVVCICAQSGPEETVDSTEIDGMKAAARDLNQSGGVLGHSVQIVVENDNSTVATGVSALTNYLATNGKPDLLIPGVDPEYTQPEMPIGNRAGVLSITDDAASAGFNDPSKYPLDFGVVPPNSANAAEDTAYFQKHGYTKVGVLEPAFSYGTGVIDAVTASDDEAGITTVSETYAFPTALTMVPQLQELQAAGVQAVLFDGIGAQAGYILANKATLQFNVPFIAGTASSTTDITKLVPAADYQGVELQVHPMQKWEAPAKYSPALKAFYKSLDAITHNDVSQPNYLYGYGWDIVQIAAYGAKKANSLKSLAIAKALQKVGNPANAPWVVDSSLNFSATNHEANPGANSYIFVPVGPQVNGFVK